MSFYVFFILLICSLNCLRIHNETQCFTRDSCLNSTLKSPSIYNDEIYIQHRNCFCDSVCQEYGDCCNSSNLSYSNNYECVDFISSTIQNQPIQFNPLSVWMRTKCLTMYIGSHSDIKCRNLYDQTFMDNPILFIPVTSVQTNITYRNYYCAYCNNDVNLNVKFWEYNAYCHGGGTVSNHMVLNKKEEIDYYIHDVTRNCSKSIIYPRIEGTDRPSVFIRPCKNSFPAICPLDTSADLAQKCLSSNIAYRYDIISKMTYRNIYCAICNNVNITAITCLDKTLRSSISLMNQMSVPSLSILFDPYLLERYLKYESDVNTTFQKIYSLSYKCGKSNELYDLFLKKCFPINDSSKEIIISMKCSHPIKISEDYILFNNGSLYLNTDSIILNRDEYVFIDDNSIIFCADSFKQNRPTFSPMRNILTVICTSMSLICLIIFAIAFSLILSLHNLPGKCLLLLSISIFIGQLIFISASDRVQYSSLCLISAILIHYFYLSSFFWLLIIAIQIHSTFSYERIRRETENKEKYRLLAYNIIVWCSTGMIILIACLIQFTNPESKFSPHYGYLFCSISKSNAMILFFLTPIGCLLFIIAILFAKSILAIRHSHRMAQLASASSSNHCYNNQIFIYARLASLMGLQWILLIFALIIQQTWSWIIFEIVNSLPGVFICFGFLGSQRLWNHVKQRILSKIIVTRHSSRSHTTSTTLMTLPFQQQKL